MPATDSFDDFLERLRANDQAAAADLFDRYVCRLIGLARLRLDQKLRQVTDPEDVAQSAFKSFFVRLAGGRLDLENWGGLWAVLAVITLRKCARQNERHRAAGRDVGRQETPPEFWEPLSREPTAEEALVFTDTLEHLMRGLEERERTILTLRLQGHSVPEISAQVGRTERTIHRVLAQARQRLSDMEARAAAGD